MLSRATTFDEEKEREFLVERYSSSARESLQLYITSCAEHQINPIQTLASDLSVLEQSQRPLTFFSYNSFFFYFLFKFVYY